MSSSAKCPYTRSLIICITVRWEFFSGHGNSVVIRELSLYPQSLLAKLTVCVSLCLSVWVYVAHIKKELKILQAMKHQLRCS